MADQRDYRAEAVGELAKATPNTTGQGDDRCGPEPERPSYFSSQAVRDRWIRWKLCKDGVE